MGGYRILENGGPIASNYYIYCSNKTWHMQRFVFVFPFLKFGVTPKERERVVVVVVVGEGGVLTPRIRPCYTPPLK